MTLVCSNVEILLRSGEPLFDPVSFQSSPGEVIALLGPSGIGKSSLLDLISGNLSHEMSFSGTITYQGNNLNALRPEHRKVGLVFQDAILFPHLSVGENLMLAVSRRFQSRSDRRKQAVEALIDIDLDGFFSRDPASLSGGQRARIALMRSILAEPRVLLMDEPFSKLDADLRSEIRSFTKLRLKRSGICAVLVTHDVEDAEHIADRTIFMRPASDTSQYTYAI